MDEKEELKQELQWVQYRQKMLNIMEEKLLQMILLSEQAKVGNLSSKELEVLNDRLNNLAEQVRAIDSESRRAEDGKILE
jgi:coenzyme F420-reducing hydrogenase delta subunit